MKLKVFGLILIFMSLSVLAFSQITIWLFDGTEIKTTNCKVDSEFVFYLDRHLKTKALDITDVFMIVDKKDTTFLHPLDTNAKITHSQYFSYIKGLHDGFSHKTTGVFVLNTLIGTGSALGLPLFGYNGIYVTIPNIVSTFTMGFVDVKKLPKTNDTLYLAGYKVSAKKRKIITSIVGSITGIGLGTAVLYLILKMQ